MIAIEVNFLTRRYVATAHHDRRRHEWPPDPARLFSALVATWADADDPDPGERAALEWLEAQPPPAVVASDAVSRKVVSYFVPVNDASVIPPSSYRRRAERIEEFRDALTDALFESDGEITRTVRGIRTKIRHQRDVSRLVASVGSTNVKAALQLLPEGRGKQERWFPSVTPAEPRVVYIWAPDPARAIASALDRLLTRVTRLGHSSSLVSCRLTEDPPTPTYVPGDGLKVMRSVRRGQLAALEHAYEQHKAVKPRALPFAPVRYRALSAVTGRVQYLRADTVGEWLVFEFRPGSRNFSATRAVEIATTLRKAIFRYAADPLPEGLSGHQPSGVPSTRVHMGFLALPWVGHAHADGRLMGVAIGVPDGLNDESKRALLRAVGTWEREASPLCLMLGRQGVLEMERPIDSSALVTLRPQPWCRPSQRWVSAIPVALPTHPGRLTGGTASARRAAWCRAEQAVIDSCRHVGLPEPASAVVSLDPFVAGALPAFMFPAFHQRGPNGEPVARRLIHVAVTFDRPLEGPLVLGAGRYIGLGLMRPSHLEDGGDE